MNNDVNNDNGKDLIEAGNHPPAVQAAIKTNSNLNQSEEIKVIKMPPISDIDFKDVALILAWHVKPSHRKK